MNDHYHVWHTNSKTTLICTHKGCNTVSTIEAAITNAEENAVDNTYAKLLMEGSLKKAVHKSIYAKLMYKRYPLKTADQVKLL